MKALIIALKDTLTRFRDPRALLYMLLAPLVIALIMGTAFSGQNNGDSPIYAIPVALVDADRGDLGAEFARVMAGITVPTAEGEQPLFVLQPQPDETAARTLVEAGDVRAALLIPADFSAALAGERDVQAQIEVLTDPTASISPVIVKSVVQRIALGFESAAIGGQLAAAAAMQQGASPEQMAQLPAVIAQAVAAQVYHPHFQLQETTLGAAREVDLLNYFMPSMAIFFLMFSVFSSTRSILDEEKQGTLPRLMTTPTSRAEILLGKIGGALLTGLLQMVVLVLVSGLFFGVTWGAPLGVAALTLASVTAAAGLGALTAAFARDDNQAGLLGSLISLVFAILGGNFILLQNIPSWLNWLSKLTINRWALSGFVALSLDNSPPAAILPNLAVLSGMAVLFFALALLGFNRRFVR